MSNVAIKVENISKLYQLGEVGTGTLSKDLNRWWARLRGKEDPYTKVGQVNDRTQKVDSDFVWALKDINFEVKQGEVLGIIGKNGAGKSTLLKILSKITSPSTGKIYTKGRIASLLEVGTGFHPEMTGRENIYLNGAILGMRKWEIDKKFDEIVDFAGVEAYIDTPVKRYSSGMYVRLAFAVAAFLEPEILIVDEVLAVGDAEFQKKCLGRMKDVSENNGRTVLFVSHNLNSVSELCGSAIVLENGTITFNGSVNDSVAFYCNSEFKLAKFSDYIRIKEPNKELFIKNANFFGSNSMISKYLFHADEFIGLRINVNKQSTVKGAYLHLVIEDERGNCLVETDSFEHGTNYLDIKDTGEIIISFKFPQRVFKTGKYWVSISIASHQASKFQVDSLSHFIGFEVVADKFNRDLSRIALTSVIPEVSSELVAYNFKSQC